MTRSPQILAAALACVLVAQSAPAQTAAAPPPPANVTETAPQKPFSVPLPHSANPFGAYLPTHVPEPDLANSPRLDSLIKNGKLYLSLQDAIALALENNLDLAIARYNLPIAQADVLRTRSGAPFLGVNTGVVQNTPGGGVGGLGSGAPGAGAGGTTSGAGGVGAGAGGLVLSTYGSGTPVSSYDPLVTSRVADEHATTPEVNTNFYGVPYLRVNTGTANVHYFQSFPSGTSFEADFYNSRQTVNSPFENLTPALSSEWRVVLSQQLLAGFGFGPNLRYLHIAKNDQKISDSAFRDQVVATVTQIADIYWDLVSAYQDEQVKERSLAFAQKSLDDTRKQFQLQSVPQMDVMKAESEVANRDQDLTVAKTTLQLQQSLIKNALTKRLDATLEEMPVIPTALMTGITPEPQPPVMDLIAEALKDRPELYESQIDLQNRQITRKSLRNALLPTLTATAYYSGTGLAGLPNPSYSLGQNLVSVPAGYPGALSNAFNNSSPDYLAQLKLSIPLRNRQAKADQFRSELEYRQAELRIVQLQKQIRIEVRNAAYALEQNAARVEAARKARDLAQRTFDIMKQEQQLGAGSSFQTLSAEHDLGVADSALVAAESTYEKSRIEVDRATGATLDRMGISVAQAKAGVVANPPAASSGPATP